MKTKLLFVVLFGALSSFIYGQNSNYSIEGPSEMYNYTATYTIKGMESGSGTVSWSHSSNIKIIDYSPDNQSVTVQRTSYTTTGTAWIEAIVSRHYIVKKDIMINKSDITFRVFKDGQLAAPPYYVNQTYEFVPIVYSLNNIASDYQWGITPDGGGYYFTTTSKGKNREAIFYKAGTYTMNHRYMTKWGWIISPELQFEVLPDPNSYTSPVSITYNNSAKIVQVSIEDELKEVTETEAFRSLNKIDKYEIQIWSGQTLLIKKYADTPTAEISTDGLAKGLYIVNVITNGEKYSEKLIVK